MNNIRLLLRWLGVTTALTVALVWLVRLGHGELSAPAMSARGLRSWVRRARHRNRNVRTVASGGVGVLGVLVRCRRGRRHGTRTAPRASNGRHRPTDAAVRADAVRKRRSARRDGHATVTEPTAPRQDGRVAGRSVRPRPRDAAPAARDPGGRPVPPADPVTDAPAAGSSPSDSTWIVQHGESFWSIAQSHLDELHGRHVDEREVVSYWRELIDANRSRLVTSDPDLLFTGQEIELPTVAIG